MHFINKIGFGLQDGKILLGAHEVSNFQVFKLFLFHYLAEKETEPEYKLPVLVLRIVHCYFVSAV